MARITLDATATQSARIQDAVTSFNASLPEGHPQLTVRQWLYRVIKAAVLEQLSTLSEEAARPIRNQIADDMEGGA